MELPMDHKIAALLFVVAVVVYVVLISTNNFKNTI